MKYNLTLIFLLSLCAATAPPIPISSPTSAPSSTRPAIASYVLPDEWVGVEDGTSRENPYLYEGHHIWLLQHPWPDDWRKAENFKPLLWTRGHWGLPRKSEGEQSNRPAATIESGEAHLSAFASRLGSLHGQPLANKSPALTFIAPNDAIYALSATLESQVVEGDGPIHLLLLKRSDDRVDQIADIIIDPNETVLLKGDAVVRLKTDAQLIFLPILEHARSGGIIHLKNLKITATQ